MLQPTQTSWVILAGGQATRMGNRDKGLVRLNGKPFIEHVLERLKDQTNNVLISANRNVEIYSKYAQVVSDTIADFPGPLGGIQAGLSAASTDWVGFIPCDSPKISNTLVKQFCEIADDSIDVVIAHDGESIQPVFALFHKRTLAPLNAFLARGERKMTTFYQECRTRYVDFSRTPECFVNLNTPDELAHFGTLNHD